MTQRILIDPVSRIEGHAKISIYLDDDGKVEDARFHVVEFRGFERFCVGRPLWEMAGITARICGICPVSHLIASAKAGDNVGVLLRGTTKDEVERGMVLAKPGSITPHLHFKAEVYVLSKDEGGRHTPFFTNYRPQFYFRTTDVTGTVTLPTGVEMVMPGDNVSVEIKVIAPVAMERGQRFAIREGGRTIGAGRVTDVIA